MIVKKVLEKKDQKYENFYKKRLRENKNYENLKANTEYQFGIEEVHNEDVSEGLKDIKITKNTITENKEDLNSSYLNSNKEPPINPIKKNGDNFFITNLEEFNEPKNFPSSLVNNNLSSIKILNYNSNNSILNNSISQNNINIVDTENNHLNKNHSKIIEKFSHKKLSLKNTNIQPHKKLNSYESMKTNRLNSNKSLKQNVMNTNQAYINNNKNNFNNNLDYVNSSMSSNTSININKSIRHFKVNYNLNTKGNIGKNESLIPMKVFSANNLNSNFSERKNYQSIIKSNEESQNFDDRFKRAKSSNNVFNKTEKISSNKISNKEREMMFRLKKLNEEISNIAPVNEDHLEKSSKRVDFKRSGQTKKVKSENRACKFYQDKNYEKITSNFKKTSLDKMNEFYANKFNLNNNLNIKFESNHYRDYFSEDIDIQENNNVNKLLKRSDEVICKEQNPICIKFFNILNLEIYLFLNSY